MKILAAIAALVFPLVAFAADKPLYTLYTGFQKGTYMKIAEDMQKACPQFQINVEQTQGTLQNINSLITTPAIKNGNRLAFVQEDALDAIIGTEPRARQLYKVVTPLYKEEITVIANKQSGITTLKDLDGKKVASGLTGSGIWFTANNIKQALGIKWLQIDRTPEESVLLVLTGEVDAMIVVGGAPLRLFQELGKPMEERIFMLPVKSTELDKLYSKAEIKEGTYAWQDYSVETRATQSILIAAADVPDTAIKEFQTCLVRNLTATQKFGHPKWKEISLQLTKFSKRKK